MGNRSYTKSDEECLGGRTNWIKQTGKYLKSKAIKLEDKQRFLQSKASDNGFSLVEIQTP